MEFTDEGVVIDKPANTMDEMVLDVVGVLQNHGVKYAVVSGYVAVLFGRARSTEDIDVITERFTRETASAIACNLEKRGYWGPAMPLDDIYETLSDDLPIRVAREGDVVPNVEMKFASDRIDRWSLKETVEVKLREGEIQVGSLELQIAYKLAMGARKDHEDALHLYSVTEGNLNIHELERYVRELGVEEEYDELRS